MAIASRKKDSVLPVELPVVEEIVERRDSTFTVLVPEQRVESLLKYVEGYPWTVVYYGQILNTNSTVNHFDVKEGDLSQSYVEIKDLVLKVQSPLGYSYDEKGGDSSLNGSAIMPYKVIPNPGDVFLANVDSGEDALFVVTNVTRKTHRKNTLYEIEYSSLAYVNDDPMFLERLKKRINETYYYDNSIDSKNTQLLVTPKEKFHIDTLRRFLHDSKEYYFRTFAQRQSGSLGVPGVEHIVFDQVLDEFVNKTVDTSLFNTYKLYSFSNYGEGYMRDTILDCLIKRVLPTSKRVERKLNFYPSSSYFLRGQLHSPYFSTVDYLISVVDRDERMVSRKQYNPYEEVPSIYDVRNEENYDTDITLTTTVNGSEGESVKPILPSLFENDFYIVSENFYQYLTDKSVYNNLSFVELLIYRYLSGENVPMEDSFKCISRWEDWSYLHQFYYLPVVWFLANQSIGVI